MNREVSGSCRRLCDDTKTKVVDRETDPSCCVARRARVLWFTPPEFKDIGDGDGQVESERLVLLGSCSRGSEKRIIETWAT